MTDWKNPDAFLTERNEILRTQVAILRSALEFYAHESSWQTYGVQKDGKPIASRAVADSGRLARTSLDALVCGHSDIDAGIRADD